MAYEKQTFVNNSTVLTAEMLDHIEAGIVENETNIQKVRDTVVALHSGNIPEYWEEHLTEKIARIKDLQDAGGKASFSFVVITDMHYATNLGKISPLLAKKIMDECGIKYALVLGDMQNRSAQSFTREQTLDEWSKIATMMMPIAGKALVTQGNHDGSYGTDNAFNLTPAEIYNRIYRKVGINDNIHFDTSGTGYYVDDVSNKVRYLILNTHCNKYELNEGGTAKYGNLDTFRFAQSQYDLVIEALNSIPADDWGIIIGSHIPLDRTGEYVAWGGTVDENGAQTGDPADCVVMQRLLNAYQNKTIYSETFVGTGYNQTEPTANFTNLVDEDSTDYYDGYYLDNDGVSLLFDENYVTTNYFPCKFNKTTPDYIRVNLFGYDGLYIVMYDADNNLLGKVNLIPSDYSYTDLAVTDGVLTWKVGSLEDYMSTSTYGSLAYVRFSIPKSLIPTTGLAVSLNEELTYNTDDDNTEFVRGYDTVVVDVDFSNAKGKIISYHGGHTHKDIAWGKDYGWNGAEKSDFYIISTRSDAREENESSLISERVAGTITEQSFDVFTINRATGKLYATKIGAGNDREIYY